MACRSPQDVAEARRERSDVDADDLSHRLPVLAVASMGVQAEAARWQAARRVRGRAVAQAARPQPEVPEEEAARLQPSFLPAH